jgi:hypothetical protein
VGKLGLEVNADVDLGFMRWLTVSVPGHPDRQILLEKPGRPRMSEETAEQVRELLTKGAMGGSLIFSTDDCRKTYEELSAKGVDTENPRSLTESTAAWATPLAMPSASPVEPPAPGSILLIKCHGLHPLPQTAIEHYRAVSCCGRWVAAAFVVGGAKPPGAAPASMSQVVRHGRPAGDLVRF